MMNLKVKRTQHIGKILSAAVLFTVALALAGCGKTIYSGGEEYPYEVTEKGNGTLILKLDGSARPGYKWTYELETAEYAQMSEDGSAAEPLLVEPPVSVKQKGREKKGVAKYKIKPVSERDVYQIVFKRENPDAETAKTVYSDAGIPIDKGYEDVCASCTLNFTVIANERGKLKVSFAGADTKDMTGIERYGEDTAYPFTCLIDDEGRFVTILPNIKDWEYDLVNLKQGEDGNLTEEETIWGVSENSTQLDYSDVDDPVILAQLQALEQEERAIRGESNFYENDEVLMSMGMLSDSRAAGLPEDERYWYLNPHLHIWRDSYNLSSDLLTAETTLKANEEGLCRFSASSALVNMKIDILLEATKTGKIKIRDVSYEGGTAAVENAIATEYEEHTMTDEEFLEEGRKDGSYEERKKSIEDRDKYGATEEARLKLMGQDFEVKAP